MFTAKKLSSGGPTYADDDECMPPDFARLAVLCTWALSISFLHCSTFWGTVSMLKDQWLLLEQPPRLFPCRHLPCIDLYQSHPKFNPHRSFILLISQTSIQFRC